MAVNERTYIRIMPESTGDRVGFFHGFDVEYTGRTANPAAVGDDLTGQTSGTKMVISQIKPDNDVATAGVFSGLLKPGYEMKAYTAGENLLVSGLIVAVMSSNYCVYYGVTTLASYDNPYYRQRIDQKGQAYIRSAEGEQQFDAFGATRVSQAHQIGEYIHLHDTLPQQWHDVVAGAGNIAFLPNEAAVRLQCGTVSGDKAQRTTHKYHRYKAGASQLVNITVAIGDTGKAGVRRRWGYFDNDNGAFFELDGTILYVVIRSRVTGSVVETRIAKTGWTGDTLDGIGLSKMTLNASKLNVYWMDMQWLGAGRVRLGVYGGQGERIVAHAFENANENDTAYMSTASLPIRVEQENTGTSASTSEMRLVCAAVYTESPLPPDHERWHWQHSIDDFPAKTLTTGALLPIFSMRATQYANVTSGIVNHYGSAPEILSVYSNAPMSISMVKNASLTGAVWTRKKGLCDFDQDATAISGGEVLTALYFASGANQLDLDHFVSYTGEHLHRKADGTPGATYTFAARTLSGSGTINLGISWFDYAQTT